MGNIDIKTLSGKIKELATLADNNGKKNGILDTKEEINLFNGYVDNAIKNNEIDEKEIMGLQLSSKSGKLTKDDLKSIERKEKYALLKLQEVGNQDASQILADFKESLGTLVDQAQYKDIIDNVEYILNEVNKVGYHDKKSVEDLYDTVKDNLHIGRKDKFPKTVLKILVKNAENTQKAKEFNEISEKYDQLRKEGLEEEVAFDKVKEEFKEKGSYYKDFVKGRRMSEFEKQYIMPTSRGIVRDYVNKSEENTYKKVKKDVKNELKAQGDDDKYTRRARKGERTFKEKIQMQSSDMKTAYKIQARENKVEQTKQIELTESEIIDEIGERRAAIFEALVDKGFLAENNGKYNLSELSDKIRKCVGADYNLNKQNKKFRPLDERVRTTSALSAALDMPLTEKDAKKLVELCGYETEGLNWAKGFYKAVVGAVIGGAGGAVAAGTNPLPIYYKKWTPKFNTNIEIKNVTLSQAKKLFEEVTQIENKIFVNVHVTGETMNILSIGSRYILETAAKTAAVGFAAGLLDGITTNDELPETITQFECTTIEDYAKQMKSDERLKALSPRYTDALIMLAKTFAHKDKDGNVTWDCEGFKAYLNNAAGNGSVLNREELVKALNNTSKNAKPVETKPVETKPEKEYNIGTAEESKTHTTKEAVDIPTVDGRKSSWSKLASMYDCLIEDYGLKTAIRILKIAQAVNDGDYSAKRLVDLAKLSFESPNSKYENMKNIKGIDHEVLVKTIQADWIETVKVPDKLAGCDKKQKSIIAEKANTEGAKNAPVASAKDSRTVTRTENKFAVKLDNQGIEKFDSKEQRDARVNEYKKQHPNAKVTKYDNFRELENANN